MTAEVMEIADMTGIEELASDAESDGHRFVTRLLDEWRDGTNRFAADGECFYAARLEGKVVAVGGRNIDPYVSDPNIGRVRHLYVARSQRRRGLASLVLQRIVDDGRRHFGVLRLRTRNPEAAAFYRARGFVEVIDDEFCTHELELGA